MKNFASPPRNKNYLKMKALFLISFFSFFLMACPKQYDEFEYSNIVGYIPINLTEVNSEYDDYNSSLPPNQDYLPQILGLTFSTNRNGNNFDLISYDLSISYHEKDDQFDIAITNKPASSGFAYELTNIINSQYDELGPYFYDINPNFYYFFANNKTGDFDIQFVGPPVYDEVNKTSIHQDPVPYYAINSDHDDYYPCVYNSNNKILFCSNRNGNDFDIYESDFSLEKLKLNPQTQETAKSVGVLNSEKDDKCPSTLLNNSDPDANVLVFTSNREGGFGGFDLYYSIMKNGSWTAPINFGEKINSEFDEYRPIFLKFFQSDSFIMVFSSNRPGGKGGFDLYAVRVKFQSTHSI